MPEWIDQEMTEFGIIKDSVYTRERKAVEAAEREENYGFEEQD